MQIHEITLARVNEGFLGDLGQSFVSAAGGPDLGLGNPATQAASAAKGLASKGYGPGRPKPSVKWEDKYKEISTEPAIKQFISSVAQGWVKNSAKFMQDFVPITPNAPTTAKRKKPARAPSWGTAKPGQMSSGLAGSKTGQNMQQMFGPPKGGIDNMQSDLEESDIAADEKYKQTFIKYSDDQLATKVPGTGETITMDLVRSQHPDLATKLTAALDQIVLSQGTAAQASAIEEYVKLASAGVRAEAQRSKNQYGTQQTNLGISSRDLASLKALRRTPQGLAMIKQELGL